MEKKRTDQTVKITVIAAALVIFPEFFYLRDLFGTRMNTIFKFYYQAWILFGLSAAYAVSFSAPAPFRRGYAFAPRLSRRS